MRIGVGMLSIFLFIATYLQVVAGAGLLSIGTTLVIACLLFYAFIMGDDIYKEKDGNIPNTEKP